MKERLLALLRWTAFVAALFVLVAAAVLWRLESGGWLVERVRALARRETGLELEIDEARLDWFGPAVILRGVRLPGEPAPLELENVELSFEYVEGQFTLARIDVDGGRIELSESLLARFESAQLAQAADDTGAAATPFTLPTIVVERLQWDWIHPNWGLIRLGRGDVLALVARDGTPRVEGRIQPDFAAADAGLAPEIYLAGRRDQDGRIHVSASCAGVPIDAEALPERSPAGVARAWRPRARLSFALDASFQLDASAPPSGTLRLHCSDGSLAPPTTPIPVTNVTVDVEALCSASSLAGMLAPDAWQSTARVAALWKGLPVSCWALLGANAGPGLSARAWLHAPSLPVTRELAAASGYGAELEEMWAIADPDGSVDALVGARWPAAGRLDDTEAALRAELCADLVLDGKLGACYSGLADSTGTRREGVPLRVDALTGRIVALHDLGRTKPTRFALLEILGAHSKGRVEDRPGFADGIVQVPSTGEPVAWLDLRVGGHGVPIDAEAERGLRGLSGTDFIFPEFSPRGGEVSVVTRLHQQGSRYPAAVVSVDIFGTQAHWRDLPLELEDVQGHVLFLSDHDGDAATGFELTGRSLRGAELSIRGRLQDVLASELPPHLRAPAPWTQRHLEAFAIEVRGLALRGDDREAIATAYPEVDEVLATLGASGRADVSVRSEVALAGEPRRWRAEIEPREAELLPARFPVALTGVRGRVLVDGELPTAGGGMGRTRARVAPLVGRWVAGGVVAATASIPDDADGRILVSAASVDLSNASLAGAFGEAQSRGLGGGWSGPGLADLNVTGRVDFDGEFVLPLLAPRAPESRYRVYLRRNDVRTELGTNRLDLGRLEGVLEQSGDGLLVGERIGAELAGTRIELRDASFGESEGRFAIETEIDALRLQVDREHLAPFLDEATVHALVDDLGWSGELDVRGAKLRIETGADGRGVARFSGAVTPRGMRVDFGLPIEVDEAEVSIEELLVGPEGVRFSAAVSGLSGRISDRELERASLRLEYREPRLEVIGLSAGLENGRIDCLAGERVPRPFFAIELKAPYRFELALALRDVDIGRLLKGVFESDFASRGRLAAQLELSGDLERLTGIRGKGRLEIDDTVLWSMPVVRELLESLDIKSGAVFEHVETNLEIERGRVAMKDLLVESPLVKLVGEGTLDLDGSLSHDLEVQYQLLDWLGFFNRLIYWVQSSLIRVAIRGDMSRPRIEIKGVFGRSPDPRRGPRDLPLPGLSPLPPRF